MAATKKAPPPFMRKGADVDTKAMAKREAAMRPPKSGMQKKAAPPSGKAPKMPFKK